MERFAERAIAEAERAGDETTIGKVRYVLSRERFYTGRYAEGLEQARTAVATLEATEEWWWLGHALGWEAINLNHLGEFDLALRDVERMTAIGRERQDPRLQSYSAQLSGCIHMMRGDWEAAIANCAASLESSPDLLYSSHAMGWLGLAHRETGDHARAIVLLEQSVALLTEFRFRRLACVCAGFLAGAYRLAGRTDEAREAAEGALLLSDELRYPWSIGLARRELGRIDIAAGDLLGAERHLGGGTGGARGSRDRVRSRGHAPRPRRARPPPGRARAAARHLGACREALAALGAPAYLERAELLARQLEGLWWGAEAAGERLADVGPPSPEAEPGEAESRQDSPAPA